MMSLEMREGIGDPNIADPALGPAVLPPGVPLNLAPVTDDAMLVTSARASDGTFTLTGNSFPLAQSIILYYVNTTPEGNTQLIRLQLFYIDDLHTDTGPLIPPFTLSAPAYFGNNIVIQDGNSVQINIDRATGSIGGAGGVAPTRPPRVLMNQTESFDIVSDGVNPPQIRISCQTLDKFNRAVTTRLTTEVELRNAG
jgi:hypothetical protein